jgi:hypothetical protein
MYVDYDCSTCAVTTPVLRSKCCARVLRTASCPAKLAGPIAVRSTLVSLAGWVTVCLACEQRLTILGVLTAHSTKIIDRSPTAQPEGA